jgi:hypothetical protein
LYDLAIDPNETNDISKDNPKKFSTMKSAFMDCNNEVEASVLVKNYPEGEVRSGEPIRHFWMSDKRYEPFLDA